MRRSAVVAVMVVAAASVVAVVLPHSASAAEARLYAYVDLATGTYASAEVTLTGADGFSNCIVSRRPTGYYEQAACTSTIPALEASMDAVQFTIASKPRITMVFLDTATSPSRCFQARAINSLVGPSASSFTISPLFTDLGGTTAAGPFVVGPVNPSALQNPQSNVAIGSTGCQVGQPPPPVPPDSGGTIASPRIGERATAGADSGRLRLRRRGASRFTRLTGDASIPVGSTIDARQGRARVTVAVEGGRTQTAVFYGGIFQLLQKTARRPVAEMKLVGKLEKCARTKQAAASKKRGRRLSGAGRGRFRIRGKYAEATAKNTTWLVEDRCDHSTLTRVTKGRVQVRDFVRDRTVVVRADRSYVARKRR